MVDVKTETKPVNPRDAIREQRQRRLRVVVGDRPATIKVYAANEAFRETLRHPSRGIRFRDDGSAEWPNDSFTARRIREGSVRTDSAGSGEMIEPDESINPREQAALNQPKPAEQKPDEQKPEQTSHRPNHKRQPEPEPPQPAA